MAHHFWLGALISGNEGWLEDRGSKTANLWRPWRLHTKAGLSPLPFKEMVHESCFPRSKMKVAAFPLLVNAQIHSRGIPSDTTHDDRRRPLTIRPMPAFRMAIHGKMLSWHPAILDLRRTASVGTALGSTDPISAMNWLHQPENTRISFLSPPAFSPTPRITTEMVFPWVCLARSGTCLWLGSGPKIVEKA